MADQDRLAAPFRVSDIAQARQQPQIPVFPVGGGLMKRPDIRDDAEERTPRLRRA